MKALEALVRGIDAFNEKVGVGVSMLTAALVVVVCLDVFTRYALNFSVVAVQELEWHLFSAIFLLGAAWTLKHDKHVRVDVIYQGRGPRAQAWINLIGSLVCLVPFCALVVWASWGFVEGSWSIGEGSENPGGLPARWVLKACIPISFVMLGLQGVSMAASSVLILMGRPPQVEGAGEVSP